MDKKIYMFWLGDENKKKQLLSKINRWNKLLKNWEIELGPSKFDHEYLMNNFAYYKKAYENKIYALCSDVYRTYKIYNNGGIYIDSGCEINIDNFNAFINTINEFEYCFVLERMYYFWNGMFYSKNKYSPILEKCLNHFYKHKNENYEHTIIMPIFFSKYLFNEFGYNIEKNKNILIVKSCDLFSNESIFKINPNASWWDKINTKVYRPYTVDDAWKITINSFYKKENKLMIIIKRIIYTNFTISKLYTYNIPSKILVKLANKNI